VSGEKSWKESHACIVSACGAVRPLFSKGDREGIYPSVGTCFRADCDSSMKRLIANSNAELLGNPRAYLVYLINHLNQMKSRLRTILFIPVKLRPQNAGVPSGPRQIVVS